MRRQLNLLVAETKDDFPQQKLAGVDNFSKVNPGLKEWLKETALCGEGWILQFSMTWHAICVHSADECKHLKKLLGTSTIGHVSFVFDLGLLLGYLL